MAKHKAPTQVTIASIQEKTFFHEFVERYWRLGAGLAVVGSLAVLIPTYLRHQAQRSHHEVWDDLRTQASLTEFGSVQAGKGETLALFAEQHKDSPVGTWARALEVGSDIDAGKFAEAQKAAEKLNATWPDHPLSTSKVFPTADGGLQSLPDSVRSGAARLQAWEKEHAFLFANPDLPADAPKVRLNTSAGAIVLGLYSDRAPKHAENFLELCKKGYYNGTKFHRVVRGNLVQGGDPNTISGEPDSWGLGGPGTTIEPETDPRLRHFKGALSAWKAAGETRSHGSQFFINTANQNQVDGQYVVFGRVIEGDAVLEAIEAGAVVGDRPQDPVVIQTVDVL